MKTRILLFALLFGASSLWGQTEKIENLQEELSKCINFEDWECARKKVKKLLWHDFNNANFHFYYFILGRSAAVESDYEKAEMNYTISINLKPTSFNYYYRAINTQFLGDTASAIKDLTRSIELSEDYYYPYFLLSSIYLDQRNFEKALETMEALLLKDPFNISGGIMRATIFKKSGDMESALKEYDVLIENNEDNAALYNNRADTKMEMEQYESAMEDIEISLLLDEEAAVSHITKGQILLGQGKGEEACEWFNKAIELGADPSDLEEYSEACGGFTPAIKE